MENAQRQSLLIKPNQRRSHSPGARWANVLLIGGLLLRSSITSAAVSLDKISVGPLPRDKVLIKLQLSAPAPRKPQTFTLDKPTRIVLDLPNVSLGLPTTSQSINIGAARTLRTGRGDKYTRVVLDLARPVSYHVSSAGNVLVMTLDSASEALQSSDNKALLTSTDRNEASPAGAVTPSPPTPGLPKRANKRPPIELLSQTEASRIVGRGADTSTTNNQTATDKKATIGEKFESTTAAETFLRDQAVLLKAKQVTLELGLNYSHATNQSTVFDPRSFTIQVLSNPAGIAVLPQAQAERNTFVSIYSLRYGLANDWQPFASIPLLYQLDTTTIGTQMVGENDHTRWGDVTLGLRYGALKERIGYPNVVLSAEGRIPTDNGPYSLGGSTAFAKSIDPAILFANVGYRHSFNDDSGINQLLRPGDTFNATLGFAYALNDTLTASTSVLAVYNYKTDSLPTEENYYLQLGLTTLLVNGLYIEPNVAFSLSGPGSSVSFGVNVPYTTGL